jgi:predicted protein tyrosine phosphatase
VAESDGGEDLLGVAGARGDVSGIGPSAVEPVTPEHLKWAEIIFVMERKHRSKLSRKFRSDVKNQKIVVLGIPDKYRYMDSELVELLERLVPPHLGRAGRSEVR